MAGDCLRNQPACGEEVSRVRESHPMDLCYADGLSLHGIEDTRETTGARHV